MATPARRHLLAFFGALLRVLLNAAEPPMRGLQRVLGVPRIGWVFVAPNLVILGLFALYLLVRVAGPTVLRILRPLLLLAFVLAALWALYPAEMCSIEFLSKLPILCAR